MKLDNKNLKLDNKNLKFDNKNRIKNIPVNLVKP